MRGARRLCASLASLAIAGVPGCSEAPRPVRTVLVQGEIRLPPGVQPAGNVTVNLYHAWSLQGELRHPLQLIESFESAPGAFSHRLEYPEADGEGLVVYAWADVDGDGVLCTPERRGDLAGLTEAHDFPADTVSVTVSLGEPCRGPDWFYPRAPAAPREEQDPS